MKKTFEESIKSGLKTIRNGIKNKAETAETVIENTAKKQKNYDALYERRINKMSKAFGEDNSKIRDYMIDKNNRNFENFKTRIDAAKTQEERIEIARSVLGNKVDVNATQDQLMTAAAKHYSSKSVINPQFHDYWNANHMTQKTVGSGLVLSSVFALTGDKGHLSNPQLYGQE